MSEADKLFEKIGYKKIEHNINIKPGDFIPQDEPYIMYEDEKEINGTYYTMFIIFHITSKLVEIGGSERGKTPYGKDYFRIRNPILNIKEIKAISMKVRELKWQN